MLYSMTVEWSDNFLPRARITFDGAFHHGMNRRYEGRPIFRGDQAKHVFLELLEKSVRLTKTRVLA